MFRRRRKQTLLSQAFELNASGGPEAVAAAPAEPAPPDIEAALAAQTRRLFLVALLVATVLGCAIVALVQWVIL